MPATSMHKHPSQSGHSDNLPAADQHADGQRCPAVESLACRRICGTSRAANKYPTQVWNINNAARNLIEIIANAARDETEAASTRVRIFTIGMGAAGAAAPGHEGRDVREHPQADRQRPDANGNPDFNSNQLEGAYYYAETAADVAAAFQALQNQIVRLTK